MTKLHFQIRKEPGNFRPQVLEPAKPFCRDNRGVQLFSLYPELQPNCKIAPYGGDNCAQERSTASHKGYMQRGIILGVFDNLLK